MIENITISGMVSPTALAQKSLAQSASKTSFASSTIKDTVTIDPSAFSVKSPIEDYLPQSRDDGNHISTKKKFKSNKELLAYLMLLDARMKRIEEKGKAYGGVGAPIEHRAEYSKLRNEMKELTSSIIV